MTFSLNSSTQLGWLYVHHAHPEDSAPEYANPPSVVGRRITGLSDEIVRGFGKTTAPRVQPEDRHICPTARPEQRKQRLRTGSRNFGNSFNR